MIGLGKIELVGKYDSAKIFTENVDSTTIDQITEMLNQPFAKGAKTRIMPDAHAGKGAVIGTTMRVSDKIVPNIVGVDLGCGVLTVELKPEKIDFNKLDTAIRSMIPSGKSVRSNAHEYNKYIDYESILAPFDLNRSVLSMGTLGGGNHFIEMSETGDGRLFLVIHSGSRHLGVKVATYHQKNAIDRTSKDVFKNMIDKLKEEGKEKDIQNAIQKLKLKTSETPKDLMYLEGKSMDDYVHDLSIAQSFAKWNRAAMVSVIKSDGLC